MPSDHRLTSRDAGDRAEGLTEIAGPLGIDQQVIALHCADRSEGFLAIVNENIEAFANAFLAYASCSSNITRNRAVVRCDAVGQIQHHLVDKAPAPAFRRVIPFDNGMSGGMKVPGRMTVRRTVATADMSASAAQPQVDPFGADLQAFLAPKRAWCHIADVIQMRA